ncbi:hypothetical protein Mal48_37740 [Thalassoglobus polymorphus]|uniref:Uncharacterized protein n=1 Tax=Thalassoglobus polymorphus TaxID=2527994 RepID=A0A517QSB7_9PLAN|nr:hypothetical protein Mal48_37740 [Thalassoglobus polymorphus]
MCNNDFKWLVSLSSIIHRLEKNNVTAIKLRISIGQVPAVLPTVPEVLRVDSSGL